MTGRRPLGRGFSSPVLLLGIIFTVKKKPEMEPGVCCMQSTCSTSKLWPLHIVWLKSFSCCILIFHYGSWESSLIWFLNALDIWDIEITSRWQAVFWLFCIFGFGQWGKKPICHVVKQPWCAGSPFDSFNCLTTRFQVCSTHTARIMYHEKEWENNLVA